LDPHRRDSVCKADSFEATTTRILWASCNHWGKRRPPGGGGGEAIPGGEAGEGKDRGCFSSRKSGAKPERMPTKTRVRPRNYLVWGGKTKEGTVRRIPLGKESGRGVGAAYAGAEGGWGTD